ncbi:MAG: DUF503 domain-containing protein [Candidatus Sumerlaeia bacterium]|nr:DUF503 domain-containing protein [Candidatus Sumerlaeia bacterium]
MVIGLLQIELHLPVCNSLKDKRSILKRLFARLRQTYNVGVAETGHQDVWRSAQMAVVTVFNERTPVEQTLSKVAAEVVGTAGVEVIGQQVELL